MISQYTVINLWYFSQNSVIYLWKNKISHYNCISRQNCGDLFVKIGSASQQMQMLDIIHSYLSSSELFAKWHELLFSRAIKYSEILLQYISSKTIDKSNVSLLHKQMLLLFINKSATEQTVHSEMVQRVAFGESIKKFTVSFEIICSFTCEKSALVTQSIIGMAWI